MAHSLGSDLYPLEMNPPTGHCWIWFPHRARTLPSLILLIAGGMLPRAACPAPRPLQTLTIREHLQHEWTNEIVHFPIAYRAWWTPQSLMLTDAAGQPVPCQVSDLGRHWMTVTGTVWTVVNLPPRGEATFQLRPGRSPPSALRLVAQGSEYVLTNELIALRLPRLPGALMPPADLSSLPAPLLGVALPGGEWLGRGVWTNPDRTLLVKEATTSVIEEGPVRVTVRYRLTFRDDRFYQADIALGDRQDCALFTDDSDVDAPQAAFRFSFQPGLRANRVYWRNNYYAEPTKGLTPGPIAFDPEQVIGRLRPWSFWWLKNLTTWAGFYREGSDPLVGVLAVRPSRWTPVGWDGFERTEIPITARPGGQLDLTLALAAWTKKATPLPASEADEILRQMSNQTLRADVLVTPQHRELAITLGPVVQHVTNDVGQSRLRRQLIKYSEFPLDEVKDYAFDFQRANPRRAHPFLLFNRGDIDRARKQVQTVPALAAQIAKSTKYMAGCGVDAFAAQVQKEPEAWKAFYRDHYVANWLYEAAPQAYVGSADPKYGRVLAAGVKGLARANLDQFLEAPQRPSIGGNAHLGTTGLLQLLLAYDTLAGAGDLTAEDKRDIEAVLVFGAHVADHPDYWNSDVGLMSANPNMTSLLKLPLGLLALFLDGHPRSAQWLEFAEAELQRELKDWIAPGGAWIECPMYQAPSLDGMFLLSQAMKNVKGKDYFADPQFRATMDYYGFILTPPDRRFPPGATNVTTGYMTVPSIGDAFPGFATPFNGWMARATAQADPAYSARQQFYWQGQDFSCLNGGRAGAYMMAICDAELPAAPPADLARAFPGFGNILRTSWTDPKASYVAHRCGYFLHHFDPGDDNSILYFAKGAPLAMDFGHRGAKTEEVITMWRPDFHNTVSFDRPGASEPWGVSGGSPEVSAQAQAVRSLPATIDYSTGLSVGSGGQRHQRHLLLVKSADPLGANYLVLRDVTQDGQPNQAFTWNLWCMAQEPDVAGNVAHFPGQFGVDLDAHVLSPANPQFVKGQFSYEQWVNPWGKFLEGQTGVHVRKQGSSEDFLTVLYPRAAGQGPAQVTVLATNAAVQVGHLQGTDVVLLSPGKPVTVSSGDCKLTGEIAYARRSTNGDIRLAVLSGTDATAALGTWELTSSGPVAIRIQATEVGGESSGEAHEATLRVPETFGVREVFLDGQPRPNRPENRTLKLLLPAGNHTIRITRE